MRQYLIGDSSLVGAGLFGCVYVSGDVAVKITASRAEVAVMRAVYDLRPNERLDGFPSPMSRPVKVGTDDDGLAIYGYARRPLDDSSFNGPIPVSIKTSVSFLASKGINVTDITEQNIGLISGVPVLFDCETSSMNIVDRLVPSRE